MVGGLVMVGAAVVAGVATAGSVYSSRQASKSQRRAAESGADAQLESTAMSIDFQERQLEEARELLSPWVEGGGDALALQKDLAGIGGTTSGHSRRRQQAAIANIYQSPEFRSLTRSGEEAILQNASATGGLRGGNVQEALREFRPQLLNQLIQQRFNQLGSISASGQASAAGQAQLGQNTANAVSGALSQQGQALANMYTQQGQAQAGAALAQGQAIQGLGNTAMTAMMLNKMGAF